ncbi:MAG: 3-deoxy-7-phosphoheptulonate synthase [Syntrophomonadaceae bacterium]|nr:3-deoxy-7-phosphoheptulonate synthase [Syntrophomonadaceae bacterium]
MQSFKKVSRDFHPEDSRIAIPHAKRVIYIGEGYCTVIAGPCAVENREDYLKTAVQLQAMGAHILRGGLFKPRTSPYSFKGLGREGLAIMTEARDMTGMPLISEIMDVRDLDYMYEQLDILQVGSRSMQNFTLLEELGRLQKPVMLKRGLSATIEEWLLAAEYILNGGNPNVILCERGIRTFETYTRNTVDIGAVPLVKLLSHLPVIVDPSHATGNWKLVTPVAKAAIAAGADGIMVEVHPEPDRALSDGKQSLTPANFRKLQEQIVKLAAMDNKIML